MARTPDELVKELWTAFSEEGVEGLIAKVDPGVEWVPHRAKGRVLRGPDELRAYFADLRRRGEVIEVAPYSFETRGEAVLVSGHVRMRGTDGITDSQVHWVYRFDAGRLVRAEAYAAREDALKALEEAT